MNSPIVYICLLGMFLSLMLLIFNKGYKSANRFLAGVFFFGSMFYLTIFVFFFGESLFFTAIFEASIPSFFYLIGPLFYFYIRSVLRDEVRLSKLDYLHFLIFVVVFLGTLPILFSSWEHKLEVARNILNKNWFGPYTQINAILSQKANTILRGVHLLFYLVLIWLTFYKYKSQLKQNLLDTKQYHIINNWLIVLCLLFTMAAVSFLLTVFQVFLFPLKILLVQATYYQTVIMSVSYLIINLGLMFNPQILYGLPFEKKDRFHNLPLDQDNTSTDLTTQKEEAINNPGCYSPEYLHQIELSILYAETEMRYLDPKFKMEHISTDSGIPLHHLAYYFSNFHPLKYTDWRNNLRIRHAMKLITEGALSYHSFEGIFYKCGFTNHTTFNRAFKTITRMTPGDFHKSLEDRNPLAV